MEKQTQNYFSVIVFLVTLCLVWIAYAPALHEPLFFIDDALYLSAVPRDGLTFKNILYVLTPVTKPVYLPLVDLSYLIDFAVATWFGVDVNLWMRVVNFVCLSGSAVWVFKIFNLRPQGNSDSKLGGIAAILVGVIFALHPLHAIPAVWIGARKDALVCLMGLGVVFQILKRRHGRALIFCLLALASKQSAYGIILWVLAMELFFVLQTIGFQKKVIKPYLKNIAPFALVLILFFPLSVVLSSAHPQRTLVFSQSLLTFLFYLQKVFVPFPLTQYYGRPPVLNWFWTWVSAGCLISSVALVFFYFGLKRNCHAWYVGLLSLSFFAMLPYISIFPGMLLINNSYAYTLVAPCVLLLCAMLFKINAHHAVILGVLVFLIGASAMYGHLLAQEFCDPVSAFDRNVKLYPQERFLHMRLAQAAHSEGNLHLAQRLYVDILEQRMQQEHRISIESFDGLTDICMKRKDVPCLDFLTRTAVRNSHAYYCRQLRDRQIPIDFDFTPCLKKFPEDFENK